MQVLCMASQDGPADVICPVCNQSYAVYFSRRREAERGSALLAVEDALRDHHAHDQSSAAHPAPMFNVPAWSGPAHMSGAALLSGAPVRTIVTLGGSRQNTEAA